MPNPTRRSLWEAFDMAIEIQKLEGKRAEVLKAINNHHNEMTQVRTITRHDPRVRLFKFVDRLRSHTGTHPMVSGLLCVWDLNAPEGTGDEPAARYINLDKAELVMASNTRYDWTSGGDVPQVFEGFYKQKTLAQLKAITDDLF